MFIYPLMNKLPYQSVNGHGKPIVIKIKALLMSKQGFKFYLSDNGVWLTKQVPSQFLIIK